MKKIIVIVLVVGLLVYYFSSQKTAGIKFDSSKPADLTLFWGQGCPHCEKLDKYIKDNGIDTKINIDTKEVWYNKSNQLLFNQIIKSCPEFAADPNNVGVPFAFTSDKKCLSGDQPIIDYLNQKLSATQ